MAKTLGGSFNPWSTSHTRAELEAEHRRLAKRSNQRMVRLERGRTKVTGEAMTFGAYEKFQNYLDETSGKNRMSEKASFTSKEKSMNELKRDIAAMNNFLNSKSSTVRGMNTIEQQRIKTFESKGITAASNKDFYDFLNSDEYKTALKAFSSDTLIELYDSATERDADGNNLDYKAFMDEFQEYMSKRNKKSLKGLYNQFKLTPASSKKKPRKAIRKKRG